MGHRTPERAWCVDPPNSRTSTTSLRHSTTTTTTPPPPPPPQSRGSRRKRASRVTPSTADVYPVTSTTRCLGRGPEEGRVGSGGYGRLVDLFDDHDVDDHVPAAPVEDNEEVGEDQVQRDESTLEPVTGVVPPPLRRPEDGRGECGTGRYVPSSPSGRHPLHSRDPVSRAPGCRTSGAGRRPSGVASGRSGRHCTFSSAGPW